MSEVDSANLSGVADLFYIAVAWAAYGFIHSWLAATHVKDALSNRWPGAMRAYRLLFNLQAVLLLLPPLWLTWRYSGPMILEWPQWFSLPIALATVAGFVWSMKWYDGMDFMGLRQIMTGREQSSLRISPMHRYVRHPWYALGLLFMWTRDANAAWLITYCAITLYMLVGIHLEEKKLIATFGDAYRVYRKRVASLTPLPGRILSPEEASGLESLAARSRP